MKGIPKIIEVKPLENMTLLVTFDNNIKKNYYVKQLVGKYPIFAELENEELFNLVHVECGGFGIAWTDEIDLSEYEIWENGIVINS